MSGNPFADRAEQIAFTGNSLLEMMVSAAIDREMAIKDHATSGSVRAARAAIHLVREKGEGTTLTKMLDEIMNVDPTPRQQQKQHHGGSR